MVTVVDNSSFINAFDFGDSPSLPEYIGQTFVAADARLDSIEFYLDNLALSGPQTVFRVLVTTVAMNGANFNPGTVLFESVGIGIPSDLDTNYETYVVDTSQLALTPGQTYAFIIDTFTNAQAPDSDISIYVSGVNGSGTDYAGGFLILQDHQSANDRPTDFAGDWDERTGGSSADLSFKLTFSAAPLPPPPPTIINGTKGKDVIDGTHTPVGQPLPGANADYIFGLKANDRLSGLGGDDLLDGGKGKDTLFGGDGADQFQFSVGLKQPADKIMDFNPVDDTIVLAVAKFKALAPGVLSDAAFRDIGEAASPDDRIIYKASGKLLYDKDGPGHTDAHAFVKLIGAPDIAAADILVI